MNITDFTKKYLLQYNVVKENKDYRFRLNLIERNGMKLIPEQTKEWTYSISKFESDMINQQNGHQIGPFKNEEQMNERVKRFLIELLFFGYITDFHPLDKNKDIDFLFN